jgi:hypothetical protein
MSGGATELVFHASSDVPEQATVSLGSFVTACYERIRVLAMGPQGVKRAEAGEAELTLSFGQEQGTQGPLDRVLIGLNASFSRVYEVPGLMLGVSARAPGSVSRIDGYVWGQRTMADGMVIDPEQATPGPTPDPGVQEGPA